MQSYLLLQRIVSKVMQNKKIKNGLMQEIFDLTLSFQREFPRI